VNPFASRFIRPDQNAYRFAVDDDENATRQDAVYANVLHELATQRAAAIVGPHGTGKSTLVHGLIPILADHFADVSRITLSSSRRWTAKDVWPADLVKQNAVDPERRICLVIDGFEQLSLIGRMVIRSRVMRNRQMSILVTSHRRHARFPLCHETGWDTAMTLRLAEEKLHTASVHVRDHMMQRMRQRLPSQSNVRDLWFDLYDDYERLNAEGNQAAEGKVG